MAKSVAFTLVILLFLEVLSGCNFPSLGSQIIEAPTLPPATRPPVYNTLPPQPTQPPAQPPTATRPLPTVTLTPRSTPDFSLISPASVVNLKNTTGWGYGLIRKLELSPDETGLLIADSLGISLDIWPSGKLKWFKSLSFASTDAAFSPDGKTIASCGYNTQVYLWNAADGSVVKLLKGHTKTIMAVDYSPQGVLASAGQDNTIIIWNTTSGAPLMTLKGHTAAVNSISFFKDGKRLVSGSVDQTVKIWDTDKGTLVKTFTGFGAAINSVDASPTLDVIVASTASGKISVWDVEKGSQQVAFNQGNYTSFTRISPDGRLLAVGTFNGQANLYELATGKLLKEMFVANDSVRSLAFTRDSQMVITGSWDGVIRSFNLLSGQLSTVEGGFSSYVLDLGLSQSPEVLAAAVGQQVFLLDPFGFNEIKYLKGHTNFVNALVISRDARRLASAGADGLLFLWDTQTGQKSTLLNGQNSVVDLALSPDESLLAAAIYPNVLTIWDFTSGEKRFSSLLDLQEVYSIAFSNDGKFILAGGASPSVEVLDISIGVINKMFSTGQKETYKLAGSPIGPVVAGGSTGSLWLADYSTGKLTKTLSGYQGEVYAAAYSPDGQLLAAGDAYGKIQVWDSTGAQMLRALSGHNSAVNSLLFSADNRRLYSASADGSIILWTVK